MDIREIVNVLHHQNWIRLMLSVANYFDVEMMIDSTVTFVAVELVKSRQYPLFQSKSNHCIELGSHSEPKQLSLSMTKISKQIFYVKMTEKKSEINVTIVALTLMQIASLAGIDEDFPTVGISGELDFSKRYIIKMPVFFSK